MSVELGRDEFMLTSGMINVEGKSQGEILEARGDTAGVHRGGAEEFWIVVLVGRPSWATAIREVSSVSTPHALAPPVTVPFFFPGGALVDTRRCTPCGATLCHHFRLPLPLPLPLLELVAERKGAAQVDGELQTFAG